jgi:hypothetical protein
MIARMDGLVARFESYVYQCSSFCACLDFNRFNCHIGIHGMMLQPHTHQAQGVTLLA